MMTHEEAIQAARDAFRAFMATFEVLAKAHREKMDDIRKQANALEAEQLRKEMGL